VVTFIYVTYFRGRKLSVKGQSGVAQTGFTLQSGLLELLGTLFEISNPFLVSWIQERQARNLLVLSSALVSKAVVKVLSLLLFRYETAINVVKSLIPYNF
jgi:hypothetical protein